MASHKYLQLIELNEVNFDLLENYIINTPKKFINLKRLIDGDKIRTTSEINYENLEPWIQWVSVHTGLSYEQHKVFRLGDIVQSKVIQIFEKLENYGLKIGAISPMNAKNVMIKPAYFIPDPWTKTPSDKSFWSRILGETISKIVNDNSHSKITLSNFIIFLGGVLFFSRIENYLVYLKLVIRSRRAPWRKALFLDLFLHDLHRSLLHTKSPNMSTLFLNAGAHIQHHYFFNAKRLTEGFKYKNPSWYIGDEDPIEEMLEVYDRILGQILNQKKYDYIVATGLTQIPYCREKFYYRLKDHRLFLLKLGIIFKSVTPRMTRDFLIEFDSQIDQQNAKRILSSLKFIDDDGLIFGNIDSRENSLFVTLTYAKEINKEKLVIYANQKINMSLMVTFVAIKNGMHAHEGFAFFSPTVARFAPKKNSHVKELHYTILNYFNINKLF